MILELLFVLLKSFFNVRMVLLESTSNHARKIFFSGKNRSICLMKSKKQEKARKETNLEMFVVLYEFPHAIVLQKILFNIFFL